MEPVKPARRRALLLAAALLLPGCAFVKRTVPLDPSGMEYVADLYADHFQQQVDLTRDSIAHLPHSVAEHCRECWTNLTVDPHDR